MTKDNKKKEHHFTLVVKTYGSRQQARYEILFAFAQRPPDGCEFHLRPLPGHKETWMAGARSGTAVAFDLVMKSLENLRKTCCKPARWPGLPK